MHAGSFAMLWAVFWSDQLLRWGVWVGLVVLTVAGLLLIRTRWGQSQPLGKCVVLSLFAHLLLGLYAMTVNIVTSTVGSPDGKGIQVALIDDASGAAAADATDGVENNNTWDAPRADDSAGGALTTDANDAAALDVTAPAATIDAPAAPPQTFKADTAPPAFVPRPIAPATDELGPPVFTPPETPLARPTAKSAEPIAESDLKPAEPDTEVPPPPVELPSAPAGGGTGNGAKPVAGSSNPATGSLPAPVVGPAVGGKLEGAAAGPPAAVPPALEKRVGDHLQVAQGLGATQESEAAVNAALRYLAAVQSPNGRWDTRRLGGGAARAGDNEERMGAGAQADTGITGLALLAFLAGGHTHLRGPHQATVRRGLEFLLSSQESDGCLSATPNRYERMYCHAMATCALSEAYAMTRDQRLAAAVKRAVGYTLRAQDRSTGGWRYMPGDPGDTSQLGWQVMALKSAEMAGLTIPSETRDGIARFLKSVSAGTHGGLARYQANRGTVSRSMTAEALACRQFMGLPENPAAAAEASNFVTQEIPGTSVANLYYWYYGTLSMYQLQDQGWDRWNAALQKTLLSSQRTEGELAGSWDPDPVWGGCGGRVYGTALSALCLEVYYRFLPLHIQAAGKPARVK